MSRLAVRRAPPSRHNRLMAEMPFIRANDPEWAAWNRMQVEGYASKGFYHSFRLPDGRMIEGIMPLEVLERRVKDFPIPASLAGKRALDIGTWDGFFAFEMERRGASVVAIDGVEVEGFQIARQLLGAKAGYQVQSVYELSKQRNGVFDLVLFLGVLYHLKHPLLALERVCEVTSDMAIVESFVTNESATAELPSLEFYETSELLGQIDNWCGPNVQCLLAFCRTAGFARVELLQVLQQRALVACYRCWLPEPEDPEFDPPQLRAVTHASNYGVNIDSRNDDYLTAFFKSTEKDLTLDTVFPEVAGFGIRPVSVLSVGGDGWQASFRLPPGLEAGWHEVRLRTARSRFGNTTPIAVDIPLIAGPLRITGVCDGKSLRPGEVAQDGEAFLSCWIGGLAPNADRGNVKLHLAGKRLEVWMVAPDAGDGEPRQVNARLPASFPKGRYDLVAQSGDSKSDPVSMRVV
jgi:tRNA (mo5U34)-methyltransferase